jgi:type VI protein secretion system component VasF
MDGYSITQVVLLVALAFVFLVGRRFLGPHAHKTRRVLSQLQDELMERTPVYSAETTKHREAEFIRDRPRSQRPAWIILLAIAVGLVAMLWLMRA